MASDPKMISLASLDSMLRIFTCTILLFMFYITASVFDTPSFICNSVAVFAGLDEDPEGTSREWSFMHAYVLVITWLFEFVVFLCMEFLGVFIQKGEQPGNHGWDMG